LLDQFTNIMLLMLISGGFSTAWGRKDAIAILVVSVSMVFGIRRKVAEQALAALKKLSAPIVWEYARQRPRTSRARIGSGDIVLLEAGQVPADGRLLEAVSMRLREAALTGEAHL